MVMSDKLSVCRIAVSPLPDWERGRGEGLTRTNPHPNPPPAGEGDCRPNKLKFAGELPEIRERFCEPC